MSNIKEKVDIMSRSSGILLKEMRNKKGYSLNRIAIMADIDPKHLKRIEEGESDCSIMIFIKLLEIYHISIKDFFSEHWDDTYLMLQEEGSAELDEEYLYK